MFSVFVRCSILLEYCEESVFFKSIVAVPETSLKLVDKRNIVEKSFYHKLPMAAAQVAKKLKDRRQKQTLEEIFRKVSFRKFVHQFKSSLSRLIEMGVEQYPWENISLSLKNTESDQAKLRLRGKTS